MLGNKRKALSMSIAFVLSANCTFYFGTTANAVTVNGQNNGKYQDNIKAANGITEMIDTSVGLDTLKVQNANYVDGDINIISSTSITKEKIKQWAKKYGATDTFISLADLYWKYSKDHGNVNPAIAYVQAAKETGYGRFGGVLDESYHNPCGLKNTSGGDDTDPNAHHRFKTWDEGVQAHLDHLALYAGAKGYPRQNTLDPRHFSTIAGVAKTVSALGGKWAPNPKYGIEVLEMYDRINGTSITNTNSSSNNTINTVKEGWLSKDGHWYYINNDGSKATGWLSNGGHWYYLDSNGIMQTGWLLDQGNKYYLEQNGAMKIGWLSYNNQWYYLNSNGSMATNTVVDGWKIDSNGIATPEIIDPSKNGWIRENNNWYYFNNGNKTTGWQSIGRYWYYMNSNGVMETGWLLDQGNKYYLNYNGQMTIGWLFIDNNWYYFQSNGAMATNTVVDGWSIDNNGIATPKKVEQPKSGWIKDNDKWYYYNENGSKTTGWQFVGGAWYYMNSDGIMQTGWQSIDGYWYYMNSNGAMQTGWITDNNQRYYLYSNGSMARDTVIDGWTIATNGVATLEKPSVKNGWVKENNNLYYYNEQGVKTTGWQSIDGYWYYMNSDGIMQTGWLVDGGIKYYLNSNGQMTRGWLFIGSNWYYFRSNGSMVTNDTVDGWNIDENGVATKNQKLIVVDAGHNHGGDDGAYSNINGVRYSERDLNMQVAVKLQTELLNKGYKVAMTRQPWDMLYEDSKTSLQRRADLANNLNADLFISLHHDSGTPSAHGTTSYYSSYKIPLDPTGNGYHWGKDPHGYEWYDVMLPDVKTEAGTKSERFAQNVINSLSRGTGLFNRGFHDRSLSVTAKTKMPSVLIELGFITNSEEAIECSDSGDQSKKAKIIANEVQNMF
ncbi:cell wall hydrolase/autolysin [Clostridium fallax]|uniref:N-acetylmuramoyl-L-alanine amidase n=1 Tax=Clostridium fallax TaxID=1533 RepID=A0A1M4SXY1_9CLOT|nr:N-acetylmuramoyl-L-alanine amidase [Clostridium fallax]SQB08026.1 cell wall hydrolase/autolysin [Clostridium fallax]